MDMNPQRVRTAQFTTVKRGLDPDQVQAFLAAVADELERAQNQSTAMEARARAAVARLQEISSDAASQSDASAEIARPTISEGSTATSAATSAAEPSIDVTVDQSEMISRTLLLAQRTADTAVAEARVEAQRLRDEAEAEVAGAVESSRAEAQELLAGARAEARKAGEHEKSELAGEVNSLMARRDFLESDVDHMEQFLVAQRSRLRDAANEIMDLTERVPSGLGESRRPLLSAATEGILEAGAGAADDDSAAAMASEQQVSATDDPTMALGNQGDAGSGPIMKFGFDNGFDNDRDNDRDDDHEND
ncbi:DivIVA domain-containing protein [Ilumatobacter sp.]|uniref:DivIVA domain-containing protein n=1 Tax=Ilumatobacter sp. TaxID=1967498 RepID=UPI0037515936